MCLSKAFSLTFLLEDHALSRSVLKKDSYWDYKDDRLYEEVKRLYGDGDSPYQDLKRSLNSVYSGWISRQRSSNNIKS